MTGTQFQTPQYLKVIPTFSCARGCFYCYNDLLKQRASPDYPRLLGTLVKVLARAPEPMDVEIIGGEPLEFTSVEQTLGIIDTIERSRYRSLTISTAQATSIHLPLVIGRVSRIYLSIDISRSPRNRKRLRGDRLRALVRRCADAGTEICTSSVLFGDETPEELDGFVELLIDCGVPMAGFTHQTATPLSLDDVAAFGGSLFRLMELRYACANEIEIVGAIIDDLDLWIRGASRSGACECGDTSMVIEPDGSIGSQLCRDHLNGPPITPAELLEHKRTRLIALEQGECAGCDLWEVCRGGCLTEAVRFGAGSHARAPYFCAVLQTAAALAAQELQWPVVLADHPLPE